MAKQNNRSSVDRQYLKAMGIDLWVDKNSVTVDQSLAMEAILQAAPAASASRYPLQDQSPGSLAELSAKDFARSVENLRVTCSEPVKVSELLIITEEPNLSDDCTRLLESMFNAIEFDRAQWLHAGISETNDALPISDLETSVLPKAIIFMLKAKGSSTALQFIRGVQHNVKTPQGFTVASFHPQDLLDNPALKRPAWEDLKQLRKWLGAAQN